MFSSDLMPKGLHGLCTEVTTIEDDDLWKNPGSKSPKIMSDLIKAGLLESESDVLEIHIEKIKEAYPIYDLNYKNNFENWLKEAAQFKNLHLLGRTACFWYNNMDHSIQSALELSSKLLNRS